MTYAQLVNLVVSDTLESVRLFLPELALCVTILVMLVLRVSDTTRRLIPTWLVALVGAGVALYFAAPWDLRSLVGETREEIFTKMLVYDQFTVFFRSLLVFFTLLFILFTRISGIPDDEDGADIYTLVLGAIVGMCLMVSANHLLIVFFAVEMASVPSYALAGMLKGRRQSSEAALKYSVYGAGAAGVMLYGISLIAGITGSAHLPTIAARLAHGAAADAPLVLVLGGLMIMVGLAFKLSAVPFHFWCPDVFEGASAEVNAFLSVASKAAALALLVRVAIGFGYAPAENLATEAPTAQVSTSETEIVPAMAGPSAEDRLAQLRQFMSYLVAVLAAITCTFGNLAAYGQTNIKRLMAYSTIAHAGYMMMPVAAGLYLMQTNPDGARAAFASLLVYAAIYVFMNLGAFAIIAFLRNVMLSEEIDDYAGLVRGAPGLVVCFAIILFSLIGLPPMAGFLGKLLIFAALAEAQMWTLLIIGGLNTAVSLFYYLRVIKVMTFHPEPDHRPPVSFSLVSIPGIYVAVVTAPVLLLIVQWTGLHEAALAACSQLFGG